MRERLWIAGSFVLALLAGCFAGELASRSIFVRNQLGLLFGRGPLRALVSGSGIYQADILRVAEQTRYRKGETDRNPLSAEEEATILRTLIANRAALFRSRRDPIQPAAMQHQYDAVHGQILPQQSWRLALQKSKLSPAALRLSVARNLAGLAWIESQISGRIEVNEDECLRYYQDHCEDFYQPHRVRVSHLFLAAPSGSSSEVVAQKRNQIEAVWNRMQEGENFSQLVALFSEDERTKKRGGDLGFFGKWRMPLDFFSAVEDAPVGIPIGIIRTGLGFHIVLLTDSRVPSTMPFEQARPEIRRKLANQKRAGAVAELARLLSEQADYIRWPAR